LAKIAGRDLNYCRENLDSGFNAGIIFPLGEKLDWREI
jgi:hypothetical protein